MISYYYFLLGIKKRVFPHVVPLVILRKIIHLDVLSRALSLNGWKFGESHEREERKIQK